MGNFNFDEYDSKTLEEKRNVELLKNIDNTNIAPNKSENKKINFVEMPPQVTNILSPVAHPSEQMTDQLSIPYSENNQNSYLSLVLSPNLRELELMIRGLEYVKITDKTTGKEKIVLRRIEGHPLNEYGINQILTHLKIYTSPEIKLGRKKTRDYYNSVGQVAKTTTRLIYKNLKRFGMDTQEKQRNAKVFCLAIIEIIDAGFSRSIEGKENDLSRATDFKIEANLDSLNDPAKLFKREDIDKLKN